MSLPDFLQNLRTAAGLLSPSVDAGSLGRSEEWTQGIRSAALWLTPRAVGGYDRNDFPWLDSRQLDELSNHVQEFEKIARSVPDNGAAGRDEVQKALCHFRPILEALERSLDRDAIRINRWLLDEEWPEQIVGMYCETGDESDGEPALWTWFVATDEFFEEPDLAAITNGIRFKVRDVLKKHYVKRWSYVRFLSFSELSQQESLFRDGRTES